MKNSNEFKIKEKEEKYIALSPTPQVPTEKVLYDNRIKRKNVLALNEKVAAIREYEKMPVYKRIGRMFHCSPDQIKRIVQQKELILRAWEQRTRRCQDAKTLEMKVVRVSMLGKAVYDWIRRMMYYKDFMITDGLIQKMALQFKSAMGLTNFFPHQEWCDKFRQTYKITENDSKLLNIGYTQGHSVQIKDVIKDVLSECTPDTINNPSDDDMNEIKDENDNKTNVQINENDYQKVRDKNSTIITTTTTTNTTTTTITTTTTATVITTTAAAAATATKTLANIPITNSVNATKNTVAVNNLTLRPQLQSIRQLVALPIKTNGIGMMPQKVLVATPINTNAHMSVGSTPTPMTMTIIPLATLSQQQNVQQQQQQQQKQIAQQNLLQQQQQQQQQQQPRNQEQSNILEKDCMPPPMVEIKQEIKEEPIDHEELEPIVRIKEELLSDDECSNDDTNFEIEKDIRTKNVATFNKIKISANTNSNDLIDDDSYMLSNLQKLIQRQEVKIRTDDKEISTCSSLTYAAAKIKEKPKPKPKPKSKDNGNEHIPAAAVVETTAIATAATAVKTTTKTVVKNKTFNKLMPPLIRTPAAINRLATKRKHNAMDTQQLPAIKSCGEARKYLKMLEDFALFKENFRLIGLITRADEVLRELDGDDDVDID